MKLSKKKFLFISLITLSLFTFTTTFQHSLANNPSTKQIVGMEFKKEMNCLAENIYYEAATESFEGKLAVAQVTLNRANSGKFSSSVCGVVHQKDKINGVTTCQFSWTCMKEKLSIRNKYAWEESLIVARKALTEPVAHELLYLKKAMFYHANYVNPGWNLPVVSKIGNHIFYRYKSI